MSRPLFLLLSSLCPLCLCGNTLRADVPVAQYLFPAGGQRGKTVSFHAGGLHLNESCSLEMVGPGVTAAPVVRRVKSPWFEGPLLPLPESQRQEDYPRAMAGTVAIAADAQCGDRYVLMRTAQGITAPLRFVVSDLPEIVEEELDGRPVPVPVSPPVTVNGRIFPREDTDVWAVSLRKGQTLTALVDAGRIGSPLEAKLEVRGPKGELVTDAFGGDSRLRFTAREDGTYQIHITDIRGDGGPAFVYRLTLTTGSLADRRVPPNPDDRPVVRESGSPDPIRGNFLPLPSIGDGRIGESGEIDRWAFSARRGSVIELELRATRLGSPLLGVLTVTDAAGKELARVEPADKQPDPVIRFVPPADGLFFVTVRDRFTRRGGPAFAYRLRVTRPEPDFELVVPSPVLTAVRGQTTKLPIVARRSAAFNGPIGVRVVGLPPGVSAPPAFVMAPGQLTLDIPLKVEPTAQVNQSHIRIEGIAYPQRRLTAIAPITRVAKWADDREVTGVRLAVAVPTPFKIAGDYELKLIPRGTVHTRHYRIERNGFTGPIEIDLAERQARHLQGVTGPKLVVPADKSEFDYPITLPPWMDTGRTCRVCVMGTGTVRDPDGTEHVVTYSSREQNDQIIAVVEPGRLGLQLDRPAVLVESNKSVEVKVQVRRGDGLAGDATVEVIVPKEVRGVTAKGVTIRGDDGTVRLTFGPAARGPFPLPLLVRATVLDRGKPVTAERALELVEP
jgi:hypothetical protein